MIIECGGTFNKWFKKLKDLRAKTRIIKRFEGIE